MPKGSVGLNIIEASAVIFVDQWWNPTVEWQAIGRVHRIGQEKKVDVYRLVIKNSFEERILQLQEKKVFSFSLKFKNLTILGPHDRKYLRKNV